MILAVFLVAIIIVLPIIVSSYFYFNNNLKRLYFAIYIFGFIKLISGYFKVRNKGGFYLHLSKNKAIIIDFSIIKKLNGGPNYLSDFSINKLFIESDISIIKTKLLFSSIYLNYFTSIISKIIYESGYMPEITSNLNIILDNDDIFSLKFKIIFSFNLVCILKSLIANAKNVGVKYVKQKI